jgi:CRP-like cAMP-binding protein
MEPDAHFHGLTADEVSMLRRIGKELTGRQASLSNDDHVPLDLVATLFHRLGYSASSELVNAILSDHIDPEVPVTSVSFETVCAAISDWKSTLRMRLRRSADPISREEFAQLTGRTLIVSDSWWRTAWSFLVMIIALVNWTIVLARDIDHGWDRSPETHFVVLNWIFTVVYAVDIAFWTRTLKFGRDGVVDNPEEAAALYIGSPWFVMDLLAAAPLDVICSQAGAGTAAAILSHLRLLRYPRSLTYFARTHEFDLTPRRIVVFFEVMPMWFLFYIAIGFVTVLAFCHALVGLNAGKPITYIKSFYFVVQTFTTVGYGDYELRPETTSETWFGIFLVYAGLFTNAIGIGRLITNIQRDNAYTTREDKLRETLAVLKYFRIPHDLQTEILSYQEHVLWNDTANAFHGTTAMLPQSMRDTMLLQTRVDVLRHVPQFAATSDAVAYHLACALVTSCYKPEEYISFSGDPHAGVRFVLFGFVARFDSRGRFDSILKSGESFGFDGILTFADEVFSHKALSYCDIWVLPPAKLHDAFHRFPAFLHQFSTGQSTDATDKEKLRQGSVEAPPRDDDDEESDGKQGPRELRIALSALRKRLEAAMTKQQSKPPSVRAADTHITHSPVL